MDIGGGLTVLSELLKPPDEIEGDSDEELNPKPRSGLTPGNIGPTKLSSKKEAAHLTKKNDTKSIWDEEDVPETAAVDGDDLDPRPQPEYEMVFKQRVSSEDMFLQMSSKTPATSSCEDLVIKIKLPGTEYSQVNLDVTDVFLDCRTPKYKLGLHLPHPVDSKNGKAQWDKSKEMLSVTLRMVREYDFMNQ